MEATEPRKTSVERTVVKWFLAALLMVIPVGTVVSALVSVPGFVAFLVAIGATVIAGVGVWITVPSPPRITVAPMVLSVLVVVGAAGAYLNSDAVTKGFNLRSDSAATANVLSRYATVTIGTYSPDGLPVTIHNRALSSQFVTVAIEARGPDGIVIDSERQIPVMGARETRRLLFFEPPRSRRGSTSDRALDTREKFLRSATFEIVFADTEDNRPSRTSR